jgi:CRP-like cAMP-binding protein
MAGAKLNARIYKAGDTIYREGEPSEAVYLIEQGEVELLKNAGEGERHLLGILGPGKIFGEAGVILDQPRSTTARAHTNAVVSGVDRQTFVGQFRDAPLAMPLLKMLCERLIEADRHLIQPPIGQGIGVELAAVDKIRLLAASDFLKDQIGHLEIEVTRLPFRVGRRPTGESPRIQPLVDLAIVTHEIFQMSHEHFALQGQEGWLFIEDLGSEAGTLVNGRRIARFVNTMVAPLDWGENEIVVGAPESSIRFLLLIERKGAGK